MTNPHLPAPTAQDDWSYTARELIDTLPRTWTRGLLYLILVFAAVVLPWAMLSQVDETGTARGRLEPKGKTLRLDTPVSGTVAEIRVKEGQPVEAGQILLELESELARSDLQQAQTRLEGQLNRLSELKLLRSQLEIAVRTQQLQTQAQTSAQLAQLDQTQQQIRSSQHLSRLAQNRQAQEEAEVQRYRQLNQVGAVPVVKVVEVERTLQESQQAASQAASDAQQAQYKLKEQRSNFENVVRSGELAVLESQRQIQELDAQIGDLQTEIAQSQDQIHALRFQLQQRVLRAPAAGTIFELPIERAGAVVQPGQMIAQIAPENTPLVLRAQMTSQESGFLRLNMPVKIKFDAYPFQDYGVVPGRLQWISPSSKITETSQGAIETYELEIALEQPYLQSTRRIALTPGQTAVAEVIVRQRRVIDFILDPFKKLQMGGLEL